MFRHYRIIVLLFLLSFGAVIPAVAQGDFIERAGSIIESLARQLNLIGEKSEKIVSPSIRLPAEVSKEDLANMQSDTREVEENFPVGPKPRIDITNEFGEIRVHTWPERVVKVTADITAWSKETPEAVRIARAIEPRITASETGLTISSYVPGPVHHEINYVITVPQDANVTAKNNFGDTTISGVDGAVGVDMRFGVVDLRDLDGPVHVRAIGEFPLQAYNLKQGGTFVMRGAQAEFGNLGGTTKISNYLGATTIRSLSEDTQMDILSESGVTHLYLDENDDPDLVASVVFGSIKSDVSVERFDQGGYAEARRRNADARQRLSVYASFGDITVHREGAVDGPNAGPLPGVELVREALDASLEVPESLPIFVDALAGDIRITGADENVVRIQATKFVRVSSAGNAPEALAALNLHTKLEEQRLVIRTVSQQDMSTLGVTSYKVDLLISVPRTSAITVHASQGSTFVEGTGAAIDVSQQEGTVSIQASKGQIDILNKKGNVQVADCGGPVTVSASYGRVELRNIIGKQTVSCVQGRTVIDAPHDEVFVRNSGGDVKIIALEGIAATMDILAEQGDISLVMPSEPDATLFVTARDGRVQSEAPLTGTTQRGLQQFQTRFGEGTHRITLDSTEGDIFIVD